MEVPAQDLSGLRQFFPRRGEGNIHSDHALSLLEGSIGVASGSRDIRGWGGDV